MKKNAFLKYGLPFWGDWTAYGEGPIGFARPIPEANRVTRRATWQF